jgi:uncharacterized repeat protein (TIGR02543 family)
MKKILSLFIVIAILSMMMLTASAASIMSGATVVVADAPAGIIADVVELENTVEITAKLKGVVNLSSFSIVVQYNSAKASIADVATKTSYTGAKLSTSATAAPYCENIGGSTLTGWNMTTNIVDPAHATTKHFAFGYGNVSGTNISLTDGQVVSLFKVYFNKLADVSASDFTFIKVGTLQGKLVNGLVVVNQGTGTNSGNTYFAGDRFTTAFTNYVPAVTNYTVTYNTNGATGTTPTQADTAAAGTFTVAGQGDLVKAGYTFAGWKDQDNNSVAAGATFTMPAKNVTLTAQWTLNTYSVTYVENGGSTVTDLTGVTALPGTLPTTTKAGYTFAGWYTDAGLTTAAVAGATISANTTLYAKWTLDTYSVTYVENGGSTVTDLTDVTALPDPLPTTTKDRYNFVGWYTDAGLTTAAVAGATISANTTLYAKFTVKPVEIIDGEVAKGDGTGSKDSQNNVIMYKDKVTGLPKPIDTFVVSIPGKVPATVTALNINDTEFGIIFGGVKFPSKSTWAGLDLNQGKFFIKLVDPTGVLTGKIFKVKTYFGIQESGEISITIN